EQSDRSSEDLFQALQSLSGFGPYAAGSALKLLGRFDYLALDSVARSTYRNAYGDDGPDAQIRRHYEPYGRWQGLVIWMDVMRATLLENMRS
ncbi:MAG: hypothetical protein WD021_06010, partial [Rhodothermales bacterium]